VEILDAVVWQEPGDSAQTAVDAAHAARVVAELRPEQRQVLELGLLQGLSQSQIAERLGMPLGTVKSFMRRGLIKVREYLNVAETGTGS
jgi:RNA polymerase sigma-70 factor (ECF subfamily)